MEELLRRDCPLVLVAGPLPLLALLGLPPWVVLVAVPDLEACKSAVTCLAAEVEIVLEVAVAVSEAGGIVASLCDTCSVKMRWPREEEAFMRVP